MEEIQKGKLKIFFGYCAGVGKTYAMLEAAHIKQKAGIDVVAGYIEPHPRVETITLINGLESIPPRLIHYKDIQLHEFDVDAVLIRKPQLVLIDELAHTNVQGSRHQKRYADIQEVLHAGIDVYTTLNVQHLESLQDVVASITKIMVNERVPDKIFDDADQVELVDIEPADLLERLKQGKIYKKNQATRALNNFFIQDNLIALREIALRRCADRVNKIASITTKGFTKEHIMLCLSPSPSNAKVIRTASRLAKAFHGEFTALYVETPNSEKLSEEENHRLESNIALARSLGATIMSIFGENIAEAISEFAKISSISKIVIGRSFHKPTFFAKTTLIDTLTNLAPNLDIYIIPDKNIKEGHNEQGNYHLTPSIFNLMDTMITLSFMLMATCIGLWFYTMGYTEANVIMIYLLAVLFISFFTNSQIYGIVASILIVFIFNFFFVEPRFSFEAYARSYPMTLTIMLLVSMITNTITRKSKKQAHALALQAHRTEVLLETSQKLQATNTLYEVASESCKQLFRLLGKPIIMYSVQDNKLQAPIVYNENLSEEEENIYTSMNEQAVAQWVFKNNKNAGVSTSTLSAAKGLYYAVRLKDHIYAVIGIAIEPNEKLPPFEKSLLSTMLNEIALVMDSTAKHTLAQVETSEQDGI
ncbi:MAG: DUF4118 domain-containing protein [Longicatena sp.]